MTFKHLCSARPEDKFTLKDYRRLFFMGALLGAVIFIAIYGVRILNPSYIGWIYYGDNDLKQHYVGFAHLRMSSFRFPLGLIETLAYPTSISVIYTDSIPLVSLFFRCFSAMLPTDFQFFGIVGILSYSLCGATSVILLKRFINSPYVCLLLSPLFIVSFPIIQRMYYHTALAAHWIIFLAFIIWAYDDMSAKSFRSEIIWAFMGFLCVSVHSYFLPIVGMILLADRVTFIIVNKGKVVRAILPMVTFCMLGVLTLWVFGGLYGGSSASAGGLGTFGANFNTFINPVYYGTILPNLGVENYFQYEGLGYLGFGVLLLSLFVDVMLVVKRKELKVKDKPYLWSGLGLLVVSFFSSTLPLISIGTINIGTIPYPGLIYRIASIFRSNGRFIWPGMYILMLAIVVLAVRFLENKRNVMLVVILAVLLIQGIDLTNMIKEKHEYYTGDYEFTTMWDSDPELNIIVQGKRAFVFLYEENDINMETAFYAARHGMSLNSFYFARDINENVRADIRKYCDELSDGLVREDTVYIMRDEEFEASKEAIDNLNVKTVHIDGHTVFVSN